MKRLVIGILLYILGIIAVGLTIVYSIDKEALHFEMKDSAYETYITKDKKWERLSLEYLTYKKKSF